MEPLAQQIQSCSNMKGEWWYIPSPSPQQSDPVNCGIYTIENVLEKCIVRPWGSIGRSREAAGVHRVPWKLGSSRSCFISGINQPGLVFYKNHKVQNLKTLIYLVSNSSMHRSSLGNETVCTKSSLFSVHCTLTESGYSTPFSSSRLLVTKNFMVIEQ